MTAREMLARMAERRWMDRILGRAGIPSAEIAPRRPAIRRLLPETAHGRSVLRACPFERQANRATKPYR